jgi:hypothetical protein
MFRIVQGSTQTATPVVTTSASTIRRFQQTQPNQSMKGTHIATHGAAVGRARIDNPKTIPKTYSDSHWLVDRLVEWHWP